MLDRAIANQRKGPRGSGSPRVLPVVWRTTQAGACTGLFAVLFWGAPAHAATSDDAPVLRLASVPTMQLAQAEQQAECPPGMQVVDSEHCCWPGQRFVADRGVCRGTPICPAGHVAAGASCVAVPTGTPRAVQDPGSGVTSSGIRPASVPAPSAPQLTATPAHGEPLSGTLPAPTYSPGVSETATAGCVKDSECKGTRVCEAGRCVDPRPSPEPRRTSVGSEDQVASAGLGKYRLRFTSRLMDGGPSEAGIRLGRQIGFGHSSVFASGTAGYITGSGSSQSFADICIAPCNFDFEPGSYIFSFVLPGGGWREVTKQVTLQETTGSMQARYISHRGTRIFGWSIVLGLGGAGLITAVVGAGMNFEKGGGTVMWAGCGMLLASLIGYAFMPADEVEISLSPQ